MVNFKKTCSASYQEEHLRDFYVSSWQRGDSPIPMLIVRALVFTLSLGIIVWSLFEAPLDKWPIYLTTWGMIMIFLMAASGLFVSLCALKKMLPEVSKPPWYVMLYWIFYNISVSTGLLITLLYWRLLANHFSRFSIHERYFWLEIAAHGFNCFLIMIEFFASRTPVRLGNIYQPLLFGFLYAIFSQIYHVAGGTNRHGEPYIYKSLDWSEPTDSIITTVTTTILKIILYILLWGIALVRDLLSDHCCSNSSREKTDVQPTDTEVELG